MFWESTPFSSPGNWIQMTRTGMVLEKLIQSTFNHLTLLVAFKTFIGFSYPESIT
jgi:hypothetical protein